MTTLGNFLRERRESLRAEDRRYSVRQVAERVGVQPSYLSKIERGDVPPPSEETIVRAGAGAGRRPGRAAGHGGQGVARPAGRDPAAPAAVRASSSAS